MPLPKIILKYSKNVKKTPISVTSFDTPVGNLYAAADDTFLYIVTFEDCKGFEKCFQTLSEKLTCYFVENTNKTLHILGDELEAYFKGTLKNFSVPIKSFGSDFQQSVWSKLQELPFGTTQTYGDLAKALGRSPSHARAIGAACGANPHLVIVPCHRLVASGSKGGFSCGVDRKDWLLDHEKKHTP